MNSVPSSERGTDLSITTEAPYRVVDRDNNGWHQMSGGSKYAADWQRHPDVSGYAELEADRGPLRPVLPVTDADEVELRRLLAAAGRKAVATLAAAVEAVFHQVREGAGGLGNIDSWDYAWRTLTAGRGGSWEAETLKSVMLFGNDLNLDRKASKDVAEMRAAGPLPRVDRDARDQMAAVLARWVTDPARYTEVAETLAGILSGFADARHGDGGWRAVADQWLQSPAVNREAFNACYGLLYSQSDHFDPSRMG